MSTHTNFLKDYKIIVLLCIIQCIKVSLLNDVVYVIHVMNVIYVIHVIHVIYVTNVMYVTNVIYSTIYCL